MDRLIPHGKNILAHRIEKLPQKKGVLLMLENLKNDQEYAKIVHLGESGINTLNVGDTVLLGRYAGHEIEMDDKKYILLKSEEILAKVCA